MRVRLTRVGGKKNPIWRVVVADQRSPRDGRVIETVGRYNPQRQPSEIVLNHERLEHWIARGAQPSDSVKSLIRADARGPAAVEEPATPAASDEDAATEPDATDEGTGAAEASASADATGDGEAPEAADAPAPDSEPAPEADAPADETSAG